MSERATADDLGYEAARAELGEIVRRLEAGGQPLEESLLLWERGEELARICERWLSGATARLDAAIAESDGSTSPGDATAAVDLDAEAIDATEDP